MTIIQMMTWRGQTKNCARLSVLRAAAALV